MAPLIDKDQKIVLLRKFPLEAEATSAMSQIELTRTKPEDLLKYAQKATLVMSKLRHYSSELITAFESLGYSVMSQEEEG